MSLAEATGEGVNSVVSISFESFSESQPSQFHYAVSHINSRRPVFQGLEAAWFVGVLEDFERLTHIRVMAFCLLQDQVHLLLEVPPRPPTRPEESELFALLERSRSRGGPMVQAIRRQLEFSRTAANEAHAQRVLDRVFSRMYDLGWFMKSIKQDFAQWYNSLTDRRGVLWESRYQSVLTGGTPIELVSIAGALDWLALYEGEQPRRSGGSSSTFFEAFGKNPSFEPKIRFLVAHALGTSPDLISNQEARRRYGRWIFGRKRNGFGLESIRSIVQECQAAGNRAARTAGTPGSEGAFPPWIRLAACLTAEPLSAKRLTNEVSKLLGQIRDSGLGFEQDDLLHGRFTEEDNVD